MRADAVYFDKRGICGPLIPIAIPGEHQWQFSAYWKNDRNAAAAVAIVPGLHVFVAFLIEKNL
jgi:hypothetical protein